MNHDETLTRGEEVKFFKLSIALSVFLSTVTSAAFAVTYPTIVTGTSASSSSFSTSSGTSAGSTSINADFSSGLGGYGLGSSEASDEGELVIQSSAAKPRLVYAAPVSNVITGNGGQPSFNGIVSAGILSWSFSAPRIYSTGGNTGTVSPVPLPAGGLLLLSALIGLGAVGARRRKI